ncbi:unnamed protein product [Angiostrongylus costaricensis]|uniref:Alternative protein n=1 Tax=Angiostrongylus costaricensis TaxID=334426 RepID=A0A0R3PP50_ANGCS|nr:unnamed protein product [Angiostrongylus costaricensis]
MMEGGATPMPGVTSGPKSTSMIYICGALLWNMIVFRMSLRERNPSEGCHSLSRMWLSNLIQEEKQKT